MDVPNLLMTKVEKVKAEMINVVRALPVFATKNTEWEGRQEWEQKCKAAATKEELCKLLTRLQAAMHNDVLSPKFKQW